MSKLNIPPYTPNLTCITLPKNDTYVLAHYIGGNWSDSADQEGCEWKVVKFIRGLTQIERAALSDTDPRKREHHFGDEGYNNQTAYGWKEFGPGSFFGQDVDMWMHLPRIKK